jgi:putative transposase
MKWGRTGILSENPQPNPVRSSVAREARLVETDTALHVTARGNYRQSVFLSDEDRAEYLELLGHHAVLEGLEIFGWCLMANHIHVLAVPRQRAALARTMRRAQSDYSQRLNRRLGSRRGHLWQSRFYSCPLAGDAVWTVLRYIELNRVRAHLVVTAEQSPWSSAAVHCGLRTAPPLLSMTEWERVWTPERWQSVLAHGAGEREFDVIRQASQRGVPVGDESFIAGFERNAGRTLAIRPVGRPPLISTAGPEPFYSAGGTPSD